MLLSGSLGLRPELFQHPHILLQPDLSEDRQRENEKDTQEASVWEGDGHWLQAREEVIKK